MEVTKVPKHYTGVDFFFLLHSLSSKKTKVSLFIVPTGSTEQFLVKYELIFGKKIQMQKYSSIMLKSLASPKLKFYLL